MTQQRTPQQNKALYKFFNLLSDKLNEQGLELPHVIHTTLWWTPEDVKNRLWKPLQKKHYGTDSTADLEKIQQIDHIHEELMRILGERCGVEYVDFPSTESEIPTHQPLETDYEGEPNFDVKI